MPTSDTVRCTKPDRPRCVDRISLHAHAETRPEPRFSASVQASRPPRDLRSRCAPDGAATIGGDQVLQRAQRKNDFVGHRGRNGAATGLGELEMPVLGERAGVEPRQRRKHDADQPPLEVWVVAKPLVEPAGGQAEVGPRASDTGRDIPCQVAEARRIKQRRQSRYKVQQRLPLRSSQQRLLPRPAFSDTAGQARKMPRLATRAPPTRAEAIRAIPPRAPSRSSRLP